jgi:NAD(P)-dependent dehydrogenase (short-subunit alcohol dehydrogenase family)
LTVEDFNGTVGVVTGGGSGIGLAIARALLAAGARGVVLADIDADALAKAETSLRDGRPGADVLTVRTDVSVLADVEALAAATLARFGRVDVVVNNAGVIAWNPVSALSIREWRWVVDVNLWGVVHGVHVFLPILQAQGTPGHFVTTSSVGGVLAETPFMATYSATKGAIIGLSLTLDTELKMTGSPIGVTILCPGSTKDTCVIDAERSRPSDAPPLAHAAGVDQLIATIRDGVDGGQPVDVLAGRVLDAVRAGDLWVFPNPEATDMVQVRLDALGAVLGRASQQDVGR